MGQQHVLDGFVGDLSDAADHVGRHHRCGLGVEHQHRIVANDDAGVRVALGGVGVGVVGQLGETDLLDVKVGLTGEGFAQVRTPGLPATGGGLWFQYRIRIIFCQIDSFNANLECLGLGLGCWTRRLGQVLADASISKLNPALACSRRVSRCPIAAPGVHTPPGVVWWSTSCARQIAASAIILAVDP